MFKTSIITITLILFTQSSIFPTYGYFMRTNHYPQTYGPVYLENDDNYYGSGHGYDYNLRRGSGYGDGVRGGWANGGSEERNGNFYQNRINSLQKQMKNLQDKYSNVLDEQRGLRQIIYNIQSRNSRLERRINKLNDIIRKRGINANTSNPTQNNGQNNRGGEANQVIVKTDEDGHRLKENIASKTQTGRGQLKENNGITGSVINKIETHNIAIQESNLTNYTSGEIKPDVNVTVTLQPSTQSSTSTTPSQPIETPHQNGTVTLQPSTQSSTSTTPSQPIETPHQNGTVTLQPSTESNSTTPQQTTNDIPMPISSFNSSTHIVTSTPLFQYHQSYTSQTYPASNSIPNNTTITVQNSEIPLPAKSVDSKTTFKLPSSLDQYFSSLKTNVDIPNTIADTTQP